VKRNYLITFPRCGVTWTINRVRALISLAGDDMLPMTEKKFLRINHLGFSPEDPPEGKEARTELIGTQKIFTILRDARKVLVSNWYFLQAHRKMAEMVSERHPGTLDNLDAFLKSPYAAYKFSNFLKRMDDFKKNDKLGGIYFYEDIQDYSFFYEIPRIVGVAYRPTEDIALLAHKNSSEVVNTFGTDHSAPAPESLDYVQEVLKERCCLDEYRERYL
jgi:hypothetical protein